MAAKRTVSSGVFCFVVPLLVVQRLRRVVALPLDRAAKRLPRRNHLGVAKLTPDLGAVDGVVLAEVEAVGLAKAW